MIQIEKMNKVFHLKSGDVTALDNVTLNIGDGMIYGVIGYSGAGKSTLVRCLNLLETPDSGTLSVGDSGVITLKDGKAYDAQGRKMTEKKLGAMRRGIGMIFQHFNLLDRSTVFENIAYPLRYTGMKKADMEARVFELLDLVDLRDKADVYPSQLSGGQKQRVAIARALATNPKVLLCDEATSALDPATTESILTLIKDINRRLGITAVIITHEMSVIEKICNQVAIISHGRIAESGSVEEVFFHPRTEEARQLVIPEAMQPERMPHERLYRIIFNGRSSFEPVIGNLVLECGVPVNIMYADTRDIGGTAFGQMVLQLPDDEAVVRRILAFAESKGLMLEEMNHV